MSKDRIIIIGSGDTGKATVIAEQLSKIKMDFGDKYQVLSLEEAKERGIVDKIDPPLLDPPPPLTRRK